MNRPFPFTGRIRSFRYATRGVWLVIRTQRNAWIHAAATAAVVGAGFWCGLSTAEWCLITLATAAVWTAESLNTAFEFLADVTTKEFHPIVEKSKDVAAGAVLVSAVAAAVVAVLVFGPRLQSAFAAAL